MNGNAMSGITTFELVAILLPIREAYEWKLNKIIDNFDSFFDLLPIREAYEWKHRL
jgi:hypothetical protein